MREIRTSGSEGGEGHTLPDPYHEFACPATDFRPSSSVIRPVE